MKFEELESFMMLIRNVWILLILQPRDHFIHQLTTLQEEFICSGFDRMLNLNIKFLAPAQRRSFTIEDEIHGEISDEDQRQYGVKPFIAAFLGDPDGYWHYVATICFTLSPN
jgi:hypothetical protein